MSDSARISPTAHYTGQVWCRHDLSPPELSTTMGQAMFAALRGPMRLAALAAGGMTLEKMLLQRHLIIDHLLEEAIAAGTVGQVVEVAAGLSGRGLRLTRRHPGLVYVEADLPGMAARKRRLLAGVGEHQVVAVDALADSGPHTLDAALAQVLDPARGVAIVTEGLVNYFERTQVEGMWRRFAAALGRFPHGLYLSDLHLDAGPNRSTMVRAFRLLLGTVARGHIHLHYDSVAALRGALAGAGFGGPVELHRPSAYYGRLAIPPGRDDYVEVLAAVR